LPVLLTVASDGLTFARVSAANRYYCTFCLGALQENSGDATTRYPPVSKELILDLPDLAKPRAKKMR